MSKKKNTTEKLTSNDVIPFLSTDPSKAFDRLVSSGLYAEESFWHKVGTQYLIELRDAQPDHAQKYYLVRIIGLRFFFDLGQLYAGFIKEHTALLKQAEANPSDVIKILFLALDLAEVNAPFLHVKYSREALRAVNVIYRITTAQKLTNPPRPYSTGLFDIVTRLFQLHTDNFMLATFLDLYLRDELLLFKRDDEIGYDLKFISEDYKKSSLFILEDLKAGVKRNFMSTTSHTGISEEKHFQKHDPKWKTNEGLAVVYYNSNMKAVSAGGNGLTSLHMDDDIFELMGSTDPVKQQEGVLKSMQVMMEDNFHHKLRHALADVYQLKEEINIHSWHLELGEGNFITLFELLAAVCAMTALSDNFRYASEMAGFPAVYKWVKSVTRNAHPEYTDVELEKATAVNIATHFPLLEKRDEFSLFVPLTREILLANLIKVEELKAKSPKELEAIIDLLSSSDYRLPYNFLFKTGETYLLAYQVCGRFAVARDFYDDYITGRLFTNKLSNSKAELLTIGKNHESRELMFNQSLQKLLLKLTPYVKSNIDYESPNAEYNFGELEGDIDVIAYFEEENLLVPIQVKLSNRTPWDEQRKKQWVTDKITGGAVKQVNKDIQLTRNREGLKFIASKLELGREVNEKTLRVRPLIVTDNFFADHVSFCYGDENESVLCVSYFEIENLVEQRKVDGRQGKWESPVEKKSGEFLLRLLDENVFWNFLTDVAPHPVNKSLTPCNGENRIHLMI